MLKTKIKLLKKEKLAPQTYFLEFFCPDKIELKAGQFANFNIPVENKLENSNQTQTENEGKSTVWRSYSFCGLKNTDEGQIWQFLVSSKMGGPASQLFDKCEVGLEINAMAPIGRFRVINSSSEKIFVCTGTGIAPFVAMIEESLKLAKTTLFFGTSAEIGDYGRVLCDKFLDHPNFRMYSGMFPDRVDNETEFVKNGTVTELLPIVLTDFEKEFYLCGNPFMVQDVEKMLLEKGVQTIVKENFGKI